MLTVKCQLNLVILAFCMSAADPGGAGSETDHHGGSWANDCNSRTRMMGTNDAFLLELDATNGTASPVSGLGSGGYAVSALAIDSGAGVLYATDAGTGELITIAPPTGVPEVVGPIGFDTVISLAFDPTTGTLYGTDTESDQLLSINPVSGTATAVGFTEYVNIAGLEFVPLALGDYDGDGDIDLHDHAEFTLCLNGPGGLLPGGCEQGDFDCDEDVDLFDWSAVLLRFAGERYAVREVP